MKILKEYTAPSEFCFQPKDATGEYVVIYPNGNKTLV